jgi:hypothetical protein
MVIFSSGVSNQAVCHLTIVMEEICRLHFSLIILIYLLLSSKAICTKKKDWKGKVQGAGL